MISSWIEYGAMPKKYFDELKKEAACQAEEKAMNRKV